MMTWEAHFAFQKSPLNAVSPKQLRMFYDKQPFFQEAERRKEDIQKMLLQSNTSVEKVSNTQAGSGV